MVQRNGLIHKLVFTAAMLVFGVYMVFASVVFTIARIVESIDEAWRE